LPNARDANLPAYQRILAVGRGGCGKAQPLTCMVQTPVGPVPMGSLSVGDFVIGGDGRPTEIVGIYPQGKRQCYKISFKDGSFTFCDIEHLLDILKLASGRKNQKGTERWSVKKTMSLREIIAGGFKLDSGASKIQIPMTAPVEYGNASPGVDPYTVGALLGDGYCCGNSVILVCNDRDIIQRVKKSLPEGMSVNTFDAFDCDRHVIKDDIYKYNRLKSALDSFGISIKSGDKFIPQEYLVAPVHDRIDLLRGLMDTDGTINGRNCVRFNTTSKKLVLGVQNITQSLGGTSKIYSYARADKKSVEYSVSLTLNINPFYLPRKASKWKTPRFRKPARYIEAVEKLGIVEQQCIEVAAEHHTYLTDDFIVTHNTAQMWTLPGKKFAYIFDPSALATIRGMDLEYEAFLPDAADLDATLKGFNKGAKDDKLPTGTKQREPSVYMDWVKDLNTKHEAGFFLDYDWLFLDSYTLLVMAIMDRQMWLNNRYGGVEELADYRVVGAKIAEVSRSIFSLPINIYATGHLNSFQDDKTKKIEININLPGKARTMLPLLCSNIWELRSTTDEKGAHVMYTKAEPRGFPDIRTSIPGLKPIEDLEIKDFGKPNCNYEAYGIGALLKRSGVLTMNTVKKPALESTNTAVPATPAVIKQP
jgi:hypothetical protein